jgi:iron complex outermembrane recepter protein
MLRTLTPLSRLAQALCLSALTSALAGTAQIALAQAAAGAAEQSVVVTGSLREGRVLDAPYAVTVVDAQTLRASGPMINLSEALARVPGLVINNRSNYAQDLQVSSRGFGARAGFGVRGLRLYADGIPASGPDGQGQVAHFDIAGAERIEVLRGPFSVLYGNSSGGVIALYSAPAKAAQAEVAVDGGSFGLKQLRASVGTPLGDVAGQDFDLRANVSRTLTEGFRPQSAAERSLANARLGWSNGADRVVLLASHQQQAALDPLGLSRAQLLADARQTTPQALQFNTRKTIEQDQAGASWRHAFADGVLRETQLSAYAGNRAVVQYLAIAPATQTNVRHGGGVIDFDRRYEGVNGRVTLAWNDADLVLGASRETQHDARKGYENFTGAGAAQVLGVAGKLRRDESNSARTEEAFAQGEWRFTEAVALQLGLRSGSVALAAEDNYLSNGNDSGRLRFHFTNPVLGLRWKLQPQLTLHASVARGFESPTLGELAYRADGLGGFNLALKPQTSQQAELGAKWRSALFDVDAALFSANTRDEIGVATNAGGRSAFQNVGRTQRSGAELSFTLRPATGWRAQLSLTALDASYRDNFFTCAGIPCASPTVAVPAGNRIAGTQRGSAWAELAWASGFGEFGVELRGQTRSAINDTNSEFAPGCGSVNLRWSHRLPLGAGFELESLLRVENLADRVCVGSVIVNDANGRYYEPAPPRSGHIGLRLLSRW